MREIKFRAWHKTLKEMLPNVQNHINDKDWAFGSMLKNEDLFVIEQYTGLKDKNGVEIYEGDVVKTGTDKVMVIGWSKKHASFVIDREGWAFRHYFGEAFDGEDCEVIGNIHQNPSLI